VERIAARVAVPDNARRSPRRAADPDHRQQPARQPDLCRALARHPRRDRPAWYSSGTRAHGRRALSFVAPAQAPARRRAAAHHGGQHGRAAEPRGDDGGRAGPPPRPRQRRRRRCNRAPPHCHEVRAQLLVEIRGHDGRRCSRSSTPPARGTVEGRAPFSLIIGNAQYVRLSYDDGRSISRRTSRSKSALQARVAAMPRRISVQVPSQGRHRRGAPVVVQSMTNTIRGRASDGGPGDGAGARRFRAGAHHGQHAGAAAQVAPIRERLDAMGCEVPLIGDFHFNGHKLLTSIRTVRRRWPSTASTRATSARARNGTDQFATMIEVRSSTASRCASASTGQPRPGAARAHDGRERPPRRAARCGRCDARGDDRLRPRSAAQAEKLGLPAERIVISCKLSGVQDLILVYRELARPLPLRAAPRAHGSRHGLQGHVASSAAMAVLLQEGIGDTIRVSLTPEPGGDRTGR